MKFTRFIYILFAVLSLNQLTAQTDNCSAAPLLPVNVSCVFTGGTSTGATQTIPGCAGNADDDVWYRFTATATSHSVTVVGSASYDAVLEIFSGSCSSLTSLNCVDATFNGGTESTVLAGLTIGNTYYIRIYHYAVGSGSGTFNICVSNAPTPPSNDACSGAIPLTVNAGCVNTTGNSYGATQSLAGCAGTANDDVWFSFVANNYTQTIQTTGSTSYDAVLQVFNGSCGALTSFTCVDNTFSGGTESVTVVGLVPGTTYFFRVFDYYSGNGSTFSVCVSGNAIVSGQPNDNPCGAIQLPAVNSNCNYLQFSTIGATSTGGALAPAPASCAGGSSPFMGGFSGSTADVWFKVTVPPSGNIYITPQPNLGAGFITDGVMAIYSGATCSSLTQIACSDDYTAYPGGTNDLLPYIAATGLTPGATIYIRYWGYATSTGSFGICVQSPTNDNCSNALNICDINGYSGSTSAAYAADRPCNMFGNNETNAGVDQPNGVNTGGPFGQGGPWGVGSPFFDVNINNNSWIRFTAASTTASFKIDVANCWVGSYPSGGLQMQIFSAAAACCSFAPVSDFKEGSSTFTINANSLSVGSNYYLMIDGFAGDICNYTITALTGVSFANISSPTNSVCPGGSVLLTGPAGASSYTWLPSGVNTNTFLATPGSSINYTLIAGGVCGYKQTLTKFITVNPLPSVLINGGSPLSTCGTATTLLTGSGASTYTWNTGPTTTTINVSPSSTTSYTLSGTSAQGCINSTITTVTVNAVPNTSITTSSNTICSGSSATLNASGASTYTWSNSSNSSSIIVSPASATVYTVTGTNSVGCTRSFTTNIGVNSLPTITSSSVTICNGNTGTLAAAGALSYTWNTGPVSSSIAVNPSITTNYTVTGTASNGCRNSAITSVSVNALPPVSVNSSTLCSNQSLTLTAGGANTYNWSTGASGPNIVINPTTSTNYTVTGLATTGCTNTAISQVTVFAIPNLSSVPSVSPSNCSASTGSITNVIASGTSPFTYTWTNSSSAIVANTATLGNQPAGTYNLQIRDNQGCIASFGPYSIINPGAPAAPSASAAATSLCAGGAINLNASSPTFGATFTWSGPNSFTSSIANPTIPSATNLMSGVYSVFATSAGCSGPAQNVTVTVNNNPTPTASSSQSVYCAGSTFSLFASSAASYTWTGPSAFNSNLQNPVITPVTVSNSGLYNLSVSSPQGCIGTTNVNVTINANPSIVAFATATGVCSGNPIQLNASGGSNYVWSGPNGFNSLQQNPSIANSSTLNTGNYSITVTNSLTGCTSNSVIPVNVLGSPIFTASALSSSVCTNGSINLNAGGAAVTNYTWTGPGSFNAIGASQTINNATPANAGNYSISVTDANGCSNNGLVSVFVYSLTPASASVNSSGVICSGNTINLNASNGTSYNWSGPLSFTSTIQNPALTNITSGMSGVYTVTVLDNNNCTNTATTQVSVFNTPNLVNSNGGNTCVGSNVILFANFGSSVAVNWYDEATLTNTLLANSNTFTPNFGAFGTYTFYAQGSSNGCTSSVTPIIANYFNINSSIATSTLSGGVPLTINFTNTSTGLTPGSSVNWTFGDGNSSTNNTPNNTFTNPGTYTVQLIVSNGICQDTSDVIIKVNVTDIDIPEVFTPNGDLYNPFFTIKNLEYFPNAELQIFNRWGNEVYKMKNYKNDWDGVPNSKGTIGSSKLPTGTYFYILYLNDEEGRQFKGYVQLMY
jgi:gliding motility-associated-like protein